MFNRANQASNILLALLDSMPIIAIVINTVKRQCLTGASPAINICWHRLILCQLLLL